MMFQSYVFEKSTDEFDSLGNCADMFPKDHVIRRACYSAHAACRRHNLTPTFFNKLTHNNKVYGDIEMKLPSGASIPYSIYEADPSLFNALYDKILIQTDPPVTLQEYRRIINDSDFRIAKALHRTSDQTLLLEMIEIMLDHIHEDDVTAIVGTWFQGDFKVIIPLINDYLPELENITVVQIADNYPNLSEVKKLMNDRNITLERVNPHNFSPVILNDGHKISIEKIRQILDYLKEPNNATVFPGVEYTSLRNMLYPINSDAALPISQWMKAYDEIHLKDYQYRYSEQFPVIQLLPGNDQTPAPLDYATESIISATTVESGFEDKIEPKNPANISYLPDTTNHSSGESENLYDGSSPVLGCENPQVAQTAKIFHGNFEEVDTDDDPLDQSSSPLYKNQQNEEDNMVNTKYVSGEGKYSEHSHLLPKQGNALNSESGEEHGPISEENYVGLRSSYPTKTYSKMKSAVEDANSIHRAVEVNPHQTNGSSLQPHMQNSSQNGDSPDHLENQTTTKFHNKIFTTCALYYLKVNGTQNRLILSEAGLLSFPMKRICDELLRLETYSRSHIESLEQGRDLKSLENPNLLATAYNENFSQNSRAEPSTNIHNRDSFSRTLEKPSESQDIMEPFEVYSNRQVPPAAISAAAHAGASSGEDESLENTPVYLNRPTEKSFSKRNLRRNFLDFSNLPFDDDEKYNSFNRFSPKRGIHQKIHKTARRPIVRSFNRHPYNSPSYKTRLEDLFFDDTEPLSDYRPNNVHPINRHKSRHLPRTSENYYKDFEMPYRGYEPDEIDPYASPEMEEESDFDEAFTDEDRLPPKKMYKHFGRVDFSSLYPDGKKDYDVNRSTMEEKLKSTYEETENYEERPRYLTALKDLKENHNIW